MAALQQDPTTDLCPDVLAALSALMLAQAQEIFVHKAIHGETTPNNIKLLYLSPFYPVTHKNIFKKPYNPMVFVVAPIIYCNCCA